MPSAVTEIPAAPPAEAEAHFAAEFTFETDCWDVHESMSKGADFVLLDVRSPALFARGHVPGAVNLPHGKVIASKMAAWPEGTLFITYCAGPHCNGAARGAFRLARLCRPVMIVVHAALPGGAHDDLLLADALRRQGATVRFAMWNDIQVDWTSAPLAVVRSAWITIDRPGTGSTGSPARARPLLSLIRLLCYAGTPTSATCVTSPLAVSPACPPCSSRRTAGACFETLASGTDGRTWW